MLLYIGLLLIKKKLFEFYYFIIVSNRECHVELSLFYKNTNHAILKITWLI
ncbi:hypothetical protein TAMYLO_500003 [Tenacibaculum amylolyticum]